MKPWAQLARETVEDLETSQEATATCAGCGVYGHGKECSFCRASRKAREFNASPECASIEEIIKRAWRRHPPGCHK